MTKYKVMLKQISEDDASFSSLGIVGINGQTYLSSEQGKASRVVRKNAYAALIEQIRESKKIPNKATLEIIAQ